MAKVYLEIKKSDTTLTVRKKLRKIHPNLSCVFSSKFDPIPEDKDVYRISYKLGELFKKMKEGKVEISPERSVIDAWEEIHDKLNINIVFYHQFLSYSDDSPFGYIGQYFTDIQSVTFEKFNEQNKKHGELYKLS